MGQNDEQVVVIGAGIGGLAAAIRLAAAGFAVTVVESADGPGGKMRTMPSTAGPVDAGPTVLTLRGVFDDLFSLAGQRLDDHLTLILQPTLARHWWPDGSTLDLFADPDATLAAIETFAGPREAAAFRRFDALSAGLYAAFDAPVMRAAKPDRAAIAKAALRRPRLWPALMPGVTLTRLLKMHFRDPRLVQLFARYATYVGGRPTHAPGVLALIWRAEAAGVWAVKGGMHQLAQALARLAEELGVRFRYATPALRIMRQGGRVTGVQIAGGKTLPCAYCVFNGDPAALAAGQLGDAPTVAVPLTATTPRSLSAWVWSFAATAQGPKAADLIHHNVFFSADPAAEFGPIGRGAMPEQPSLYICAEDRAAGTHTRPERFEIIINAPSGQPATKDEEALCRTRTFQTLAGQGLTFTPDPAPDTLTTPTMLAQRFPGSAGAIYGRSPEGLMAAFARPSAETALPGLYLAGGGCHPGAGVPMAALSGQHAAAAIMQARTLASRLTPTVTPGGTLTGSAMTGRAPFRS